MELEQRITFPALIWPRPDHLRCSHSFISMQEDPTSSLLHMGLRNSALTPVWALKEGSHFYIFVFSFAPVYCKEKKKQPLKHKVLEIMCIVLALNVIPFPSFCAETSPQANKWVSQPSTEISTLHTNKEMEQNELWDANGHICVHILPYGLLLSCLSFRIATRKG